MAYRLGSHAQRVEFPECPDAFLLMRPVGQEYLDRLAELQTEERIALGLEPDADLPLEAQERCNYRALAGTVIMGWGGFEAKDGRALESKPGALDPEELREILGSGDPYILTWYQEASNRINRNYLERISAAMGKSAPLVAGIEPGAEAPAN